MISYSKLEQRLKNAGLTKADLTKLPGISARTVTKIERGEKIPDHDLWRIADYLGCAGDDLCMNVSENRLLRILREEKSVRLSGGLYHELQIRMTFHSVRIEGNQLSQEQTRWIYETRTISGNDDIRVDDIIETVNHFRAIDYCIDHAEEPLTETLIQDLHRMIKQGTRDSTLSWGTAEKYKTRPNYVGGCRTALPDEVPQRMRELLNEYEARPDHTIEDLIRFHCLFEQIHPFQDGNGRVGRLITFKECLRYGLVPFLIEDSKKMFYYRGLAQWEYEKGYLIDTCLYGQDAFRKLMTVFDIDPDQ